MIDTLIADDDPRFAEFLQEFLQSTGRVRVVGRAADGLECLQMVDQSRPQLLLLDIEMPGLSGVVVAETVLARPQAPLVVFVTGHEEYAIRAFDLQVTDYLVKPTEPGTFGSRIHAMLDRVEERLRRRDDAVAELKERVEAMANRLKEVGLDNGGWARRRLPVKDYEQGTVVLLPTEEISHIERRSRQVFIHAAGRCYRTSHSIDRLATRLEPEGFVSISSGAIVNIAYVEHLIPNGDGSYDIVLADSRNTVLSASRQRSRELLRRFEV